MAVEAVVCRLDGIGVTVSIHLFFFLLMTISFPKQGMVMTKPKANTKTTLILFILANLIRQISLQR